MNPVARPSFAALAAALRRRGGLPLAVGLLGGLAFVLPPLPAALRHDVQPAPESAP